MRVFLCTAVCFISTNTRDVLYIIIWPILNNDNDKEKSDPFSKPRLPMLTKSLQEVSLLSEKTQDKQNMISDFVTKLLY
jgi:hypothetical protein